MDGRTRKAQKRLPRSRKAAYRLAPMSTQYESPEAAKRRSERLALEIPIAVHGTNTAKEGFTEWTNSMVVNAHGGLIALAAPVAVEQVVTLEHAASGEKAEARVVFVGSTKNGKTSVGVEFLTPAPDFWSVEFPPDNWKQLDG